MTGIEFIFGGGFLRAAPGFTGLNELPPILDLLQQYECKKLDVAALYGESEEFLGKVKAGESFAIDTKTRGGFGGEGHATRETVVAEGKQSRALLGCGVDVYYVHAPDVATPIEETLAGVNDVYKTGFFKRFGLSNYSAEEVEKIYNICKEKGYPLPEVYQGNYSPIARKQETVLFPTLRKLGMSFFAYSPMAGGFLSKTKQDILDGKGRFNNNTRIERLYLGMYGKPSYLEALGTWERIAKEEGIPRADLAYRWVTYHSPLKREYGDAIIIGARNLEQLEGTLKAVNAGPLSDKAVEQIDELWRTLEKDAPLDIHAQEQQDKAKARGGRREEQ